MRKKRDVYLGTALALGIAVGLSAQALQQDRIATATLKDGSTVRGEFQDIQNDTVYMRLSADEERRLNVADVVTLDFVGRNGNRPAAEVAKTANASHVAVLRSDQTIVGRLVNVEREIGEGERTVNSPIWFTFEGQQGNERRVAVEDLARLYFGTHPNATGDTDRRSAAARAKASDEAITVAVSAMTPWMDTGIGVVSGQRLQFTVDGQIRLSSDMSDVATATGADRYLENGPLPGTKAGILLGKVGDEIFQVGFQSVSMPATGQLHLGVNDDHHADNAGLFEVTIDRVE